MTSEDIDLPLSRRGLHIPQTLELSGRITYERFMELSADYEQGQATPNARVAELQAELGQAQEAAVNVEKFMAVVRKYTSFEKLTPTLLREFVEKIVVHE